VGKEHSETCGRLKLVFRCGITALHDGCVRLGHGKNKLRLLSQKKWFSTFSVLRIRTAHSVRVVGGSSGMTSSTTFGAVVKGVCVLEWGANQRTMFEKQKLR
jgi:hypothetical protein